MDDKIHFGISWSGDVRNGAHDPDGRLQGCIFKTKRSTDRICVAVYDHAADCLDPLYDFKTSDGTGTWCDPGRLPAERRAM